MLQVEQVETTIAEWRPRFADVTNFETSWSRFFDKVGNPTLERLEAWLAQDLQKDTAQHAGLVREVIEYELDDAPAIKLTACANPLCKRPCPDEFCSDRCTRGEPLLTMRELRTLHQKGS